MELFIFEINEFNQINSEYTNKEGNKLKFDKKTIDTIKDTIKTKTKTVSQNKTKALPENTTTPTTTTKITQTIYTSKKPVKLVENIYYFY